MSQPLHGNGGLGFSGLYDQWLVGGYALARIHLRPAEVQRSAAHLRLEQRIIPKLLKSMPEAIRNELVAN